MKSLILTFSLALTAILSLSAQGIIPQPTHEVDRYTSDPLTLPQLNYEYFFYYNGNGDLYEYKTNRWGGTNWVLDSRTYYTLNANGDPTQILYRIWDVGASQLVDEYRYTLGYQANGLRNYLKSEVWYPTEGVWKTDYLRTTTYYSNDKAQEDTHQYYNDGVLADGYRDIYQYDALDRLSQAIFQFWDQGVWKNSSKEDFSYVGADAYNYQALSRYWDDAGSTWGATTSRSIQTGTSLQTINVRENYDGNNWIPFERSTNTYTNEGQSLTYISDYWDANASYWKIAFKIERSYNADQSSHQWNISERDNTLDIFYLSGILEFDYGNYPVSTHAPVAEARVIISPNPTADFVRVELEGRGISNITLLDVRGNVVAKTTTASRTAQLSLNDQPAGTYFLRVEQGGAMKVMPVVKK